MQQLQISINDRAKLSSKALTKERKAGRIPGVVYGHDAKNRSVWVNALAFGKLFREAGQSSIVSLVDGEGGKTANAIIQEVDRHPLTDQVMHVDFYQVKMNEALEAHIPLEITGEAPAVREQGGVLVQTVEEVLVSCLPKDLPHSLPVDISILKTFDDRIEVKDIALPEGVTILGELETMVAFVEAPRTDAELAALDEKIEGDVSQVETPQTEAAAAQEGGESAE